MDANERIYGVLPYFHAGGLLTVLILLSQGVKLFINRRFHIEAFLETIEKYKITTLTIVPPILNSMKQYSAKYRDLSSLKTVFVGASRVNPIILKEVKDKFKIRDVIELYGCTEAGAIIFMHPIRCDLRPGSCGIPLPGIRCKIVDKETGDLLGPSRIGELWVKSKMSMDGYLESQKSSFVDGWLPTGDLAQYDCDGFFCIEGRIKDMIKVRGWQVSPYELEEVINGISGVEISAVVGIPDENSGQLPKAFVKLKEGTEITELKIHQIIKEKFASYKHLTGGIEFIDNFPLNPSGKIVRHMLYKNNF